MCSLLLGIRGQETQKLDLICDYVDVAINFTEEVAKKASWPANEIARLELWPEEPPLVLRLGDMYSCCVTLCEKGYDSLHPVQEVQEEVSDGTPQ